MPSYAVKTEIARHAEVIKHHDNGITHWHLCLIPGIGGIFIFYSMHVFQLFFASSLHCCTMGLKHLHSSCSASLCTLLCVFLTSLNGDWKLLVHNLNLKATIG